jgi:hypothetical protein
VASSFGEIGRALWWLGFDDFFCEREAQEGVGAFIEGYGMEEGQESERISQDQAVPVQVSWMEVGDDLTHGSRVSAKKR